METNQTETKKRIPGGIKFSLIFISIAIILFAYYAVMMSLAPAKCVKNLEKEYAKQLADQDGDAAIARDADYLRLMKEKSFLQSKIAMAETDSIYLSVDFSDSTANLELSGVVVRNAKMRKFLGSGILMGGNEKLVDAMFSRPLTIESSLATIAKEPIMIKVAPKDTSEYKPNIMPDTTLTEPVYYSLQMNNGMKIFIYQIEEDKEEDRKAFSKFDLDERKQNAKSALKSVASFKVPEYQPYIKIWLPRSDAKIIYRALPRKGQIGIFI